uniref:Putative histone rna hairpin-binding protein n=1 Tax=Culex tarsalis TaxID=7177 RepID=A0A1Q3EVT4_CULTA
MSFCDMVVGVHRVDKASLTELSKQATIKKETIEPSEEDNSGGGNKQQSKPSESSSSSSGGTSGTGVERQPLCWAEQVFKEEEEEKEDKLRVKSSTDMQNNSDSRMSVDESSNTSGNRQIEIDILDSANVQKYEKLVRCDMIKSPFKRRLSGDGDEGDEDERDVKGGGVDLMLQHKKSKTHEDDHGRERFRRESTDSGDGSSQSSRRPIEYEKDIEILVRRQKQIDYGKNTLGYENYLRQVPKEQRTKEHPKTPPKHIKYSRRAWDGLVRVWRKKLHCFDPDSRPDNNDAAAADDN